MSSIRGALTTIPRRYASSSSSAATATKQEEKTRKFLQREALKVTKLSNGIVVATLENYSPVSRVSAVVNAGARHETNDTQGAAHGLRVYSSLSTKNFTRLGLSRTLDHLGAKFNVTSTREHTFYNLDVTRDNLDKVSVILAEVVSAPRLNPWEFDDTHERMELDTEVYNESPEVKIVELLHQAAYKSALNRSLFANEASFGRVTADRLAEFREKNFTADRLSLIGIGVKHDYLIRAAEKYRFTSGSSTKQEEAKYLGSELRQENSNQQVHMAFALEGVSVSSKDLLASAVLSQALGTGPRIKYSDGSNRLTRNVLPLATQPAAVSAFNLSYTDSGLFGVHVVSNRVDSGKLLSGVLKELRAAGQNGLNSQEITNAKNALKTSLAISLETNDNLVESIAKAGENATQYTNTSELFKAIDGVSNDTVNSLAKKLISSKPTLAAIGDLRSLPRLADLTD